MMGLSTYCSLNLLPPSTTPDPGATPSKTSPFLRNGDDGRSRRKNKNVMATIAFTVVIGLQIGDLIMYSSKIHKGTITTAAATDSMATELIMETKLSNNNNNKRRIGRWSDKRMCPPWHINSLETIVPENLPRPSSATRKKWDHGASYPAIVKSAPSIKFSITSSKTDCFTM